MHVVRAQCHAVAAVQDGAHPRQQLALDCASALSLRRKRCAALRFAALCCAALPLRCAAFGNNACGKH
jgi:hypothetical protein